MKLLLVDDHLLFLEGLKLLIKENLEVEHIDMAVNYREYKDKINSDKWNLMLLDINFPEKNALQILEEHKQQGIKVPVLILSVYSEDFFSQRLQREGAYGYLPNDASLNELLKAIKTIQNGEKYFRPDNVNTFTEKVSKPANSLNDLSNRELLVFNKLSEGMTVGEIAGDLFLSVKTISTYRKHILDKLNLKNNADIIRFAFFNRIKE
jgi:two-component system, NarL family, invasion response regulator UvrY